MGNEAKDSNILIPFAVDTVGNVGPAANQFLTKLNNYSRDKSIKYKILRDISISIARSNHEMLAKYKRAVETVNQ